MTLYLDTCCFNRPFDDQSSLRIRLESEAKLDIQLGIRLGQYALVWSYIMDFENGQNPFPERKQQIMKWRLYCKQDVEATPELLAQANVLTQQGFKKLDALHLACSLQAGADYFITTDDGILKKAQNVSAIAITDPIGFIKEVAQ